MKAVICHLTLALVCNVLVPVQTNAKSHDLIDHVAPAEEVDGEQLQIILNYEPKSSQIKMLKSLVNAFYTAKDKDTAEVGRGKTVKQMIELNEISPVDCSREALEKRERLLKEFDDALEQHNTIRMYLYATYFQAYKFCIFNGDQVVARDINTRDALESFYDKMLTAVDRFNWLDDLELKL